MNLADALLSALKNEQSAYATQALKNPGTKAEFDFGYRCGFLAGLEKAESILLTLLADERDGGDL